MSEQIDSLKRNIELHKQIEKQLAKRAHQSQGVIKELKQKSEALETELKQLLSFQQRNMVEGDQATLVEFLESKLEQIDSKLQASQQEYERMQSDCLQVQDKLNISKEKYKRSALLLVELLNDMLQQQTSILSQDNDVNMEKIDFEEMSREQKRQIMFKLLKQLQPYISAGNLTVVQPARNF